MVVVGPPDTVKTIENVATRIQSFGSGIADGHRYGHGPGHLDELWASPFHNAAVKPLADMLGWPYLTGTAEAFEECAALMLEVSSPRSVALEWSRMTNYLHNSAASILNNAPPDTEPATRTAAELGPDIPRLMPFDQLAELASSTGARSLIEIGHTVTTACQTGQSCPLNAEQLKWLQHLATTDTVARLAQRVSIAERTLRRRLRAIYTQLGTDNLADTITTARANNWIT